MCIGTGASKRCVLQLRVAILLCCAIQSVQIAVECLRQGLSEGTCCPVLSCDSDCLLQVIVGRSHWNCYHGCDLNVRICAKHCVFWVIRGSLAEKRWLARATVPGAAALLWNPARFARAVELRVAGDFYSFLLTLCYCVLHVLRHFVQWNCCIKAMCSTVVCCNSIMSCNSICAGHSGMAASFQYCLANLIVFCRSLLADRIGTATMDAI